MVIFKGLLLAVLVGGIVLIGCPFFYTVAIIVGLIIGGFKLKE